MKKPSKLVEAAKPERKASLLANIRDSWAKLTAARRAAKRTRKAGLRAIAEGRAIVRARIALREASPLAPDTLGAEFWQQRLQEFDEQEKRLKSL